MSLQQIFLIFILFQKDSIVSVAMKSQKPTDKQLLAEAQAGVQKLKDILNNPKWQQYGEKPCLMLKMSIDGRVASRGQSVVTYPIDDVFEFLQKEQSLSKLNRDLSQMKVLYQLQELQQDNPRINYMRYKAPWPVSERDLVNIAMTHIQGDIYYISNVVTSYPYPQQKGAVRATCYIGGYVLKKVDEKSTLVIYISDVDVAGMIPGKIKNWLSQSQSAIASRVQGHMKKQMEEKQIRLKKEAKQKAIIEAKQKAIKEAQQKAAKQAEEKAAKEAEEKAAKEAEEKAAKEAQQKAAKQAEEKAAKEAEQNQ